MCETVKVVLLVVVNINLLVAIHSCISLSLPEAHHTMHTAGNTHSPVEAKMNLTDHELNVIYNSRNS